MTKTSCTSARDHHDEDDKEDDNANENHEDDDAYEDDEKGADGLLYRITVYKKCILFILHKRLYRAGEDARSVTLKKRSL